MTATPVGRPRSASGDPTPADPVPAGAVLSGAAGSAAGRSESAFTAFLFLFKYHGGWRTTRLASEAATDRLYHSGVNCLVRNRAEIRTANFQVQYLSA